MSQERSASSPLIHLPLHIQICPQGMERVESLDLDICTPRRDDEVAPSTLFQMVAAVR